MAVERERGVLGEEDMIGGCRTVPASSDPPPRSSSPRGSTRSLAELAEGVRLDHAPCRRPRRANVDPAAETRGACARTSCARVPLRSDCGRPARTPPTRPLGKPRVGRTLHRRAGRPQPHTPPGNDGARTDRRARRCRGDRWHPMHFPSTYLGRARRILGGRAADGRLGSRDLPASSACDTRGSRADASALSRRSRVEEATARRGPR